MVLVEQAVFCGAAMHGAGNAGASQDAFPRKTWKREDIEFTKHHDFNSFGDKTVAAALLWDYLNIGMQGQINLVHPPL